MFSYISHMVLEKESTILTIEVSWEFLQGKKLVVYKKFQVDKILGIAKKENQIH